MVRPLVMTTLAAAAIAMPAATGALAEEAHRELGAHVHGRGVLNIAIEGKRVSMELEAPGMDIVGFEHKAETKEQQAAVRKAMAELAAPLALFRMPAAAGCQVVSADVEVEKEHEDTHEQGAARAGRGPAGAGTEEHAGHGGHNEFHVAYALDCANPTAITAIEFDYFKLFKGASELTVNLVTARGQSTFEVTRDKPVLDLAGMM